MTTPAATLASPCVRICALDAAGAVCIGCGRTLQEIATWADLSEEARSSIMSELVGRVQPVTAGVA